MIGFRELHFNALCAKPAFAKNKASLYVSFQKLGVPYFAPASPEMFGFEGWDSRAGGSGVLGLYQGTAAFFPKGPCAQIVYTLGPMYRYGEYF